MLAVAVNVSLASMIDAEPELTLPKTPDAIGYRRPR